VSGPHAYLSHPQVEVDPAVPVRRWGLNAVGRSRTEALAATGWARRFARIVSSGEAKAVETAEILAFAASVPLETVEIMHENDRTATGFLPPEEFEQVADAFFANPDTSIRGWERASDAQARIVSAVAAMLDASDGPTLFVGHGGVGTLLLCHLAGTPIQRRDRRALPVFPVGDQPAGGGNAYGFTWRPTAALTGWTPMEQLV
jgi:broad specificity phosphatase PhoE